MSSLVAGGTVLWRPGPHSFETDPAGVEIALVHRPKYDDWSLPKGKCEAGEHPAITAVRETMEETGFGGPLTRSVGRVMYPVQSTDGLPVLKVVHYWAMQALGGAFTPNVEVDKIEWLPGHDAVQKLTRVDDQAPLRAFMSRPATTTTLLLVRHALAGDRKDWRGSDEDRPLNSTGQRQADDIAAVAACFGISNIVSANVARCMQTVTPLASLLGITVEREAALSEAEHARDPGAALTRLRALISVGRHVAACSQGGVIPDVLQSLRLESTVRFKPRARKGSMWALSFSEPSATSAGHQTLVDAQYFPTSRPASTG